MESIVKELNSGKSLTEILSYMLKMQKINELNRQIFSPLLAKIMP